MGITPLYLFALCLGQCSNLTILMVLAHNLADVVQRLTTTRKLTTLDYIHLVVGGIRHQLKIVAHNYPRIGVFALMARYTSSVENVANACVIARKNDTQAVGIWRRGWESQHIVELRKQHTSQANIGLRIIDTLDRHIEVACHDGTYLHNARSTPIRLEVLNKT